MKIAPGKQNWKMLCCIVTSACVTLSLASRTRFEHSDLHYLKDLLSVASEGVDVAVVSCKGYWDHTDATLIRHLPQRSTAWLSQNSDLLTMLRNNQAAGKETILIVPSLGQNGCNECSRFMSMDYYARYRTTWVLLGKDTEPLARHYLSLPGSLLCETGTFCAIADNTTSGCTASGDHFWFLSMNCARVRRQNAREGSAAIRDTAINVACSMNTLNPYTSSCRTRPYKFFISLLQRRNCTVREEVFSQEEAYGYAMVRGEMDIALTHVPMHERLMEWFDFPATVLHRHTSFYSRKKKDQVVSIYGIMQKSHVAFASIVGALVATFLALLIMDILEFQSAFLDHAYDSAMLLLASVLATSSTEPLWRLWKSSRYLTLCFWFLGIFPLSTYMRSHLISTMNVREQPNHLDTIEELEEALDRDAVFPCFVVGSSEHYEYKVNASASSLARKISLAFHKNRESKKLETLAIDDCLKCALMPNHVCILNSQPESVTRKVSHDLLESKDRMRTLFTTTLTRKTFPLKEYYRFFLLRVHEGGLLHATNDFKGVSPLLDDEQDENRQLLGLTGFFTFFFIAMAVATGTLFGECLVDRISLLLRADSRIRRDASLIALLRRGTVSPA